MQRGINLRHIWKQARKTLKGQFLTFASTLFILSLVAGLLITQAHRTHVNALIAQAVGNRTWPEEDLPLANIQSYWKTYTDIDPQIRALAVKTTNPRRIHDAEALSTGKSNDNFSAFTEAVDRLGQANRGYYTRTYTLTNAALIRSIILSSTLFPLIGLLAVWGTAHRLKDF